MVLHLPQYLRETLPQYLREPWKPPLDYVLRMKENFGWRFSVMLCSAYLGVKGSLYTFTGLIQLPYYKSLGVSGRDYQIYGSVAVTPFSVKGLIGTISDTIPLFGFHKSSYIILVAVLGGLSFILLATTTLTAAQSACLFFLVSVETSVVDLLVEGKYAELMREKPETGGDMVTWVWATYHLGALLAACITGPVADQGNPRIIFWICLPIALQVILPVSQGYLKDARLPEAHRGPKWEKLKTYPRVFSLACLMAISALVQAAVNLAFRSQPSVQMTYTLTVAVSLCLLSFYCLPRRLALCNLFMFLDAALYIQIGGALDYWYTSDSTCVLGGPNFDYTYYATYVRIVAAIASFVGVVLFQTVMAGWQIRTIFYVSVLLRCAGGVFDIIIVQRWNIAVGISDKTMFMIGDAVIYDICYTLNFMPAVLLTSKLCPKEMESTTYALLAGFQNFGQQVFVCGRERARERKGGREGGRVCVCVCVCE
jgi:folate/biopterin transporter